MTKTEYREKDIDNETYDITANVNYEIQTGCPGDMGLILSVEIIEITCNGESVVCVPGVSIESLEDIFYD